MTRYALINKENKVVHVLEWDGIAEWKCPNEHFLIASEICDFGDFYNPEDETFTKENTGKKYHKSLSIKDYLAGIN